MEAGSITLPSDKAGLNGSQGLSPCDRGRAPASERPMREPHWHSQRPKVCRPQQDGWFHEPCPTRQAVSWIRASWLGEVCVAPAPAKCARPWVP